MADLSALPEQSRKRIEGIRAQAETDGKDGAEYVRAVLVPIIEETLKAAREEGWTAERLRCFVEKHVEAEIEKAYNSRRQSVWELKRDFLQGAGVRVPSPESLRSSFRQSVIDRLSSSPVWKDYLHERLRISRSQAEAPVAEVAQPKVGDVNRSGGGATDLTPQQKDLLIAIVDRHVPANGVPFSDFRQLQRERLITLQTVGPNVASGKPTELGIQTVRSLRTHQPAQLDERGRQCTLEAFQPDANARPLGDNSFPPDHPAYEAFEEATWRAKEAIIDAEAELLDTMSNPPFDFIQAILTYRLKSFAGCARAALLIVGNSETADWYGHWIDDAGKFLIEDTLQKGQMSHPIAAPGSQPLFTAELLPRITADLLVQIKRVVARCKKHAANRVLQAMQFEKSGDLKRWHLVTGLPEGRGRSTLLQVFCRLAREAVVELGQHLPTGAAAVDYWLDLLQNGLYCNGRTIEPLHIASAEYCAELRTQSREAGNQQRADAFAKLEEQFRRLTASTQFHALRRSDPTVHTAPTADEPSTEPRVPDAAKPAASNATRRRLDARPKRLKTESKRSTKAPLRSKLKGRKSRTPKTHKKSRSTRELTAKAPAKATPTESKTADRVKKARAETVAKLIKELDQLMPQMFEDESEYGRLRAQYPRFLTFKIAETRPDLKLKVLSIRGSARHIRLAQELAAAQHGRQLSTIQDDWKRHKPAGFRRPK